MIHVLIKNSRITLFPTEKTMAVTTRLKGISGSRCCIIAGSTHQEKTTSTLIKTSTCSVNQCPQLPSLWDVCCQAAQKQ